MPITPAEIAPLYNCTENIPFVCAAYKLMLKRPATAEELHYSIHMLKHGLTRRGFLYWLSRYEEFHDDFSLKNNLWYWLPCYLYKGIEKLGRRLKIWRRRPFIFPAFKPAAISGTASTQLLERSARFESEFHILSLGQINSEIEALKVYTKKRRWRIAGYLAPEFVPDGQTDSHWESRPFSFDTAPGNFLFTSPELIHSIFIDKRLAELSARTKDYFIFSMPRIPVQGSGLSVVWDANWGNISPCRNGAFGRWLRASSPCGHIYLVNHSTCCREVSLHFTVLASSIGASVIVKFNASLECSFRLPTDTLPAKIILSLVPGVNDLSFSYTGSFIDEPLNAVCCFGLSQLNVIPAGSHMVCINESEAFRLSEAELGEGFLPFFLPEAAIRSALHQNGFFEVEALSFQEDYRVYPLTVTRFDNQSKEQGGLGFYVYKESDSAPAPSSAATTFYIAKRKAAFNQEPYRRCLQ